MKPEFAIIDECKSTTDNGYDVLTIDSHKATYQGFPWSKLGSFGKRKFENMLAFSRENKFIKVVYV